ncbi:HAD-IA family hydrolase [Asticcacaulis sp.]|uniref:HAD family hydrolase n=1 Tax=Asticcacaulis sp. TaxID=1872648 RepID=UPI0031DB88BC
MSTEPQAYLFDMDGTLCHTEPLHFAALRQVLQEVGQTLDTRLFETQLAGQTTQVVFETLFPESPAGDRAALLNRKEALFRELARGLKPVPGVVDYLNWVRKSAAHIALVTNAPRLDVEFILEVLGLTNHFHALVIASELAKPKPHPMPYLRALRLCGVSAKSAIAFEDSLAGVSSATTAGIKTLGITTTLNAETLLRAGASATISDFTDPRLRHLG